MDMYHRPFVWAGREASILVFCIILLGAGCAAPSATPLPTVVSSVATVTSTGISTTAPAPPTATSAPPTPTQPEATLPPSTPTSAATMVPLVLQAIQPLGKSEIVDTPIRGLRVITDGMRKYRIAAWSPRGSFAAATPQDGPGIDVIDLESGTVTSLISDTYVLEPRWTSDGKLILHRIESGDDTLALYDPQTGTIAAHLATSSALSAPDVKNDTVVFSRAGDLVVCTAPCTKQDRALPGGALAMALAPGDSTMLAWNPVVQSLEDVQTAVVSLAADGAAPQMASAPGEGLWLPRWSPDATRLALTSIEGRLVIVDITTGARVDLGPGDAPAWSPDGTTIAYAGASAGLDYTTRNIHLIRADGSGERRRVTDANEEQLFVSPSWSPDGQQLLFVELDSGQLFVGTVPLN